ncbi:hypothetical protein ACWCY6_42760 [Streptomyces sp. 900105755]
MFDRWTVGRDMPHGTGVESVIHTVSVQACPDHDVHGDGSAHRYGGGATPQHWGGPTAVRMQTVRGLPGVREQGVGSVHVS